MLPRFEPPKRIDGELGGGGEKYPFVPFVPAAKGVFWGVDGAGPLTERCMFAGVSFGAEGSWTAFSIVGAGMSGSWVGAFGTAEVF